MIDVLTKVALEVASLHLDNSGSDSRNLMVNCRYLNTVETSRGTLSASGGGGGGGF